MKQKIILLLLCSLTSAVFAQQTNFAGRYKVNKIKTNFGDAQEFILPRYIRANQDKVHIIISRTQLDQQFKEQAPVVDTLSFEGSEFKGKTASGNISTSKLKRLNDQSLQLNISVATVDGVVRLKVAEIWKLEEDGKILFVYRTVEQGTMKYTTKAYFDRIEE
ncbi:MAG: hypothetical protein EOO42_21905 [Flavobacteriales bacterium]|nr:MAG: hypothetical protein EOO42_21905 [Flavobacteriales bacterium]